MADASCVRGIARIALISRITVFILQLCFNHFLDDYDSSSSLPLSTEESTADRGIAILLNGFHKWDSVYFLKIADEGYKYEQYMAFFPLYPMLSRAVTSLVHPCTGGLVQFSNVLLLLSCTVSWAAFIIASVHLYKLGLFVVKDNVVAYIAAVLFCINPASVFFSSVYTESLFACCLFCGLYHLVKAKRLSQWLLSSIVLSLGTATRSNGILSCGFVTHSILTSTAGEMLTKKESKKSVYQILRAFMQTMANLVICNFVVLLPFMLFQWYGYRLYCRLPVSGYFTTMDLPPWCNKSLPMPYSYIQNHYWNVGFLNYFELKQIPNFILASPMILLSVLSITMYILNQNGAKAAKTLGLLRSITNSSGKSGVYCPAVFVYIAHLTFLTAFGVTSMHVQVVTRMIASSSPVIYWFAAECVINQFNTPQQGPYLLPPLGSTVIGYFVLYSVLGVVLHCNFYPWT